MNKRLNTAHRNEKYKYIIENKLNPFLLLSNKEEFDMLYSIYLGYEEEIWD